MASVPPVPSLPPSAQLMAGTTRSRNPAFISASEKDATHHLATKPSSVSSDSYYSTQSGEERRIRNQGSVSSALAQARRLSSHTRSSTSDNSGYSTADEHPWRSSWRFAWNSGGPTGRNRLSAATSSSIVTRPEDIPGVPIGVAFGGEDDDPLQTISEQDQGHPSGASKNPRHHVERKPFSGRNR
ncbi:hypothetical protein BD410DRAFT_785846 [Rickenella mellea]|uniref:Uncharacterized protein n=1 Tax=Rickenella mellea TaxID=50990 RepID=A0A4Y7QCV8_9AGAM|nr:hypothetical protein BD410DRAFT_785846 [Rickenella mellea]